MLPLRHGNIGQQGCCMLLCGACIWGHPNCRDLSWVEKAIAYQQEVNSR